MILTRHAAATHYNNCNALSIEALISAYNIGGEWVDRQIQENAGYIADFIKMQGNGISIY